MRLARELPLRRRYKRSSSHSAACSWRPRCEPALRRAADFSRRRTARPSATGCFRTSAGTSVYSRQRRAADFSRWRKRTSKRFAPVSPALPGLKSGARQTSIGLRLAPCALRGSCRSDGDTSVRPRTRLLVLGGRVANRHFGEPPTLVGGGRHGRQRLGASAPAQEQAFTLAISEPPTLVGGGKERASVLLRFLRSSPD